MPLWQLVLTLCVHRIATSRVEKCAHENPAVSRILHFCFCKVAASYPQDSRPPRPRAEPARPSLLEPKYRVQGALWDSDFRARSFGIKLTLLGTAGLWGAR